ncbi:uncharacterized protein LOC114526041 [Dendronephthya gigantea]|uniref:uncharacterized protein LOC114526041 n=1 Tax=Dendronephthya gigantea TaxID=151771 RepID=UPI00106BD0D1|nr:uncharacterized protein LOC114526041 [Dendronephthya gigantea]
MLISNNRASNKSGKMAEKSSAAKVKKKDKTAAELMSELAALLDKDEKEKKEKKRSNKSVFFERCPTTGERVYFSKRRKQTKSRRSLAVPSSSELQDQGTTSAENVVDDINTELEEVFHQHYEPDEDDSINNELDRLLAETDKFLTEWKSKQQRRTVTWGQRMENVNTNWESCRSSIFETTLSCQAPTPQMCSQCKVKSGFIKCMQCCGGGSLCGTCDLKQHENDPFHDRQHVSQDGFYQYIRPTESTDDDGNIITIRKSYQFSTTIPSSCSFCGEVCEFDIIYADNHMVYVTLRGRYDLDQITGYECKNCHNVCPNDNSIKQVVASGFWPGTPISYSQQFSQELFEHWDIMQKRMPGVSERSFVLGLQDFSLNKNRVATINMNTFSRSFKEWKFCTFEMELLQQKNWMECPPCTISQHSGHVDGNMKLYRFRSAGGLQRNCYYKECFVASNEKVAANMNDVFGTTNISETNTESSMCGDSTWRAARNRPGKKKNLDETGLEILGCRHTVAQAAVNMFQGEIYSYAHYLQKHVLTKNNGMFLWYDVVCQYWPWLIKHDPVLADQTKPGLSVMHAKAHSWTCQVLWGGRWQKEAGATTGEEVEQINSHFSRLGNSTKHMLPEGREELLTEHALIWNKRKIMQMPAVLAKRYMKAKQDFQDLQKKLAEAKNDLGVTNSETWIQDVTQSAREEEIRRKVRVALSEEEEAFWANETHVNSECRNPLVINAVKVFPKYHKKIASADLSVVVPKLKEKFGPDWMNVLDNGEKSLRGNVSSMLERSMQTAHFEIVQLAANMNKLADSSKQKRRIRTKISSTKNNLKETVDAYNELNPSASINVEEVQSGVFTWITENEFQQVYPIRVKKKIAELENECTRYEEEIGILEKEMKHFIEYYRNNVVRRLKENEAILLAQLTSDKSEIISSMVENNEGRYITYSTETGVLKGKLALLRIGIDFAMRQLECGVEMFSKVLGNVSGISDIIIDVEDAVDESPCSSDDESSETEA